MANIPAATIRMAADAAKFVTRAAYDDSPKNCPSSTKKPITTKNEPIIANDSASRLRKRRAAAASSAAAFDEASLTDDGSDTNGSLSLSSAEILGHALDVVPFSAFPTPALLSESGLLAQRTIGQGKGATIMAYHRARSRSFQYSGVRSIPGCARHGHWRRQNQERHRGRWYRNTRHERHNAGTTRFAAAVRGRGADVAPKSEIGTSETAIPLRPVRRATDRLQAFPARFFLAAGALPRGSAWAAFINCSMRRTISA